MKIPRQLSWWIILAIALVVVIWVLAPKEPLYAGKRLGYWCNEFQSGSRRRAGAEQALHGMGSNSVPILLAVLLQRESPLHAKLASIIQMIPKGFQNIFALSRESDDLLHIRATFLLIEIGAPATSNTLAVLRKALDDPCDSVRANTVVALGKTGPRTAEAPLAVEALEHATTDKAGVVRANAYFNLAKFASGFPKVDSILRRGVEDSDSYVRVSTTNGLAAASIITNDTGANKHQ